MDRTNGRVRTYVGPFGHAYVMDSSNIRDPLPIPKGLRLVGRFMSFMPIYENEDGEIWQGDTDGKLLYKIAPTMDLFEVMIEHPLVQAGAASELESWVKAIDPSLLTGTVWSSLIEDARAQE